MPDILDTEQRAYFVKKVRGIVKDPDEAIGLSFRAEQLSQLANMVESYAEPITVEDMTRHIEKAFLNALDESKDEYAPAVALLVMDFNDIHYRDLIGRLARAALGYSPSEGAEEVAEGIVKGRMVGKAPPPPFPKYQVGGAIPVGEAIPVGAAQGRFSSNGLGRATEVVKPSLGGAPAASKSLLPPEVEEMVAEMRAAGRVVDGSVWAAGLAVDGSVWVFTPDGVTRQPL